MSRGVRGPALQPRADAPHLNLWPGSDLGQVWGFSVPETAGSRIWARARRQVGSDIPDMLGTRVPALRLTQNDPWGKWGSRGC